MDKKDFPALTGIRAIAAYMVFIHHRNPFSIAFFGKSIHNFFSEFHVGVTIFFVLSGFLIANRYFYEVNFNFKAYIIKRFARIYPMYFILTTFTFVFFAIFHSQSSFENLKIYFFNISFIRGFFDDLKFSDIAQGWSLTVEEMFYFLAPFFFYFLRKSKFLLFIFPILFLLFGFFLVFVFSRFNFYGFMNSNDFMLDFTFFGRIIEFFVGIGLFLFMKKKNYILNSKRITYFGLTMIVLCIYALSILKIGDGYGTNCILGKIINTLILPLIGIAPFFYGLVYEKTIISNFLSNKVVVVLGKSSYIFYLIHIGVFMMILSKISHSQFFLFISLNIIAIFLYKFIEQPVNIFFRKKSK